MTDNKWMMINNKSQNKGTTFAYTLFVVVYLLSVICLLPFVTPTLFPVLLAIQGNNAVPVMPGPFKLAASLYSLLFIN
jgi:hypothetical protein